MQAARDGPFAHRIHRRSPPQRRKHPCYFEHQGGSLGWRGRGRGFWGTPRAHFPNRADNHHTNAPPGAGRQSAAECAAVLLGGMSLLIRVILRLEDVAKKKKKKKTKKKKTKKTKNTQKKKKKNQKKKKNEHRLAAAGAVFAKDLPKLSKNSSLPAGANSCSGLGRFRR